ncbi:response regulator transcription factor [Paraliomyxa miuraensis]|uniref:response regulator transcription factor n=1 Tax=Paraliomyxa miuraensis TaxID=376150 RepID=UPI0022598C35|nr:response regulator [Paraliomyxa miuraensis]MCX4240020.1 response regulator [Paraliomyxa miuraensis]
MAPSPQSSSSKSSSSRGPDRVLVAEPDADERARLVAVVRSASEALGREVTIDQAADGTTAMAMWTEHPPRLVVCEVLLDGLSGLALLRRMAAERPALPPVIFVTRMARETDKYWGLRNGAHAYLARPHDDEQLRNRVKEALEKGSQAARQQPYE